MPLWCRKEHRNYTWRYQNSRSITPTLKTTTVSANPVPSSLLPHSLLFLLLLFHIIHILVNQDGPCRCGFIVSTQVFALVAKVQKGSPLVQGDASVGLLIFHKAAKGIQSIFGYTTSQDHSHQGHHHVLVQSTVSAL